MKSARSIRWVAVALVGIASLAWTAQPGSEAPGWRMRGDLSEACTCSVPCTCNFGEAPSPYSHCWAVWSLDIQDGNYGSVKLSGLHLAMANGERGGVWYIDDKATPEQVNAFKIIGDSIYGRLRELVAKMDPKALDDPGLKQLGFKTVRIEQRVGDTGNRLQIGNLGGFESDYILGLDGKTPVVVENNWSWNIQHGIKGKTKRLYYQDEYGNKFDLPNTNANQGKFDWSDKTPIYFR